MTQQDKQDLRDVPDFNEIKAWQWCRLWYIVDTISLRQCGFEWPGPATIGPRFKTLRELYAYLPTYAGQYQ